MTTITQIEIDGFKAFPTNFKLDLETGKNLLLYGENGSGKSSLYYALHALLQSVFKDDKGAKYFKPGDINREEFIVNNEHLINIFRFDEAKDNTYAPYIRITFDDGKIWRLDNGGLSSENGGNESEIRMLNKDSVFINHAYISRFHAARNSEEIDLWNVFYKDILPFHIPAGDTQFLADIYDNIVSECNSLPKLRTSRRSFKNKIDNFNRYLEKLVGDINKKASSIYNGYFRYDGEHELTIKIAYYKKEDPENVNNDQYHLYYGNDITGLLELNTPKIGIEIKDHGVCIFKPQSHFNEARLTAIALAVRFAAMSKTIVPGSFLALDDMLISLDMSNRAKVVKFLLDISDRYKIYLFTHDRMFFEYFKHKTKRFNNQWIYKEIYMDDSHQPYMRNSDSYIEEAEHYIKQHKYEIAGNFLRKAAESFCKSFLPPKKQLSADYSRLDLNGMIINSKDFATASGMSNIQLFDELDEHRKFILNPSSHDSYDIEKYLYELKRCLNTLKELDKINVRSFMKRGTKLVFILKTPAPQIDEYRFEIELCDDFKVVEQPGEMPVITKGMINYKVSKNGSAGKTQSDNTTLKRFYEVNYDKSDKVYPSFYLDGIKEVGTNNPIHTLL